MKCGRQRNECIPSLPVVYPPNRNTLSQSQRPQQNRQQQNYRMNTNYQQNYNNYNYPNNNYNSYYNSG